VKCKPKTDEEILAEIKVLLKTGDNGELFAIKLDIQNHLERNKATAIRAYKRYDLYDQVLRLIGSELSERAISK